jgi:hypothetical protein
MRRVVQEDDTGCGVACVAMLGKVDYQDARKAMFARKGGYTGTTKLRKGLAKFGLDCAELIQFRRNSKFSSHESLPFDAILKLIAPSHKPGYCHWVVWDSRLGRIQDPQSPRFKKPYKIVSYLEVRQACPS